MSIGNKIKKYREANKMTQKDIAEILESDESKKVIELLLDEQEKTFRMMLREERNN